MSANDRQVAGSHYKSALQHWDYVVQALKNRYLEGQLTKYVFRWRKKNGLQDLMKAQHYAQKLLEEVTAGRVPPTDWPLRGNLTATHFRPPFAAVALFTKFDVPACCAANELGPVETEIAMRCVIWRTRWDVEFILALLDNLIAEAALAEHEAGAGYVNQD